jgi:hypothetical protein
VLAAVALDYLKHLPEAALAQHPDKPEVRQPRYSPFLGFELQDVRKVLRREERRHALVLDGADRDLLRLVEELACLFDVERAHRQLAELRLDGRTLRLSEAREAHHAVALDEVLVDARAHVEQLRRLRL